MDEAPLHWHDQSDAEVRHVILYPRKLMYDISHAHWAWVAGCGDAANGADVPRQRRESRPPHPASQDLLRQDAMQCAHAVLSRVCLIYFSSWLVSAHCAAALIRRLPVLQLWLL